MTNPKTTVKPEVALTPHKQLILRNQLPQKKALPTKVKTIPSFPHPQKFLKVLLRRLLFPSLFPTFPQHQQQQHQRRRDLKKLRPLTLLLC